MNATLDQLFAAPPGLYRLRSRARAATILARTARQGWRCYYLDGRTIGGKAEFLAAAAQALALPSYFGQNWDAFEECLGDLAWGAMPALLLYDGVARFARAAPAEWAIAHSILAGVAERRDAAAPLYVALRSFAITIN